MKSLLALLGLLFVTRSNASVRPRDSEGTRWPYVVSVQDGWDRTLGQKSYYFKMSPDPDHPDKGTGSAYQVEVGDVDKALWKTTGWYSFQVFLAHDGRHLVRIGMWPSGKAPKAEDLAIAFYDSGVLIRSYSTLDLLKNPDIVPRSVSHYQFLGNGAPLFYDDRNAADPHDAKDALFRLPLADGTVCVFRVGDGTLVAQR